ncbi:30S ribosomal protein S8 [Candidatus Woesebacteria bacterium RBG_13_34_9]|uniref:Small ribosomal subunit protein uS8 n=1 Tax=Candidatus Woesebacteria bacterium RBG_13_34_9 TaxID=1802477 RepID=A0A1F7X570_9BACT|nr:MAG: 30S ribosomal protein S8 [Candidatus Woesebacteria bacterium RBG_13_34_9]
MGKIARVNNTVQNKQFLGGYLKSASSYPAGDFLIRLKNASMINKKEFLIRRTHLVEELAKALLRENYLEKITEENGNLMIRLAFQKKEPRLTDIKLISKPGLRIYIKLNELVRRRAPSILIISTPKGIKTSNEALKEKLGGEVIAEIL